jgi:hypothetical protein
MLQSHPARLSLVLGCAALAAACSGDPVGPLLNAVPLTVSLTTVDQPAELSPLQVSIANGGIEVRWDVNDSPCLEATAKATQSAGVIRIEIDRANSALLDCVPGTQAIHYVVQSMPPNGYGKYEVRVVDAKFGHPERLIGRRLVTVLGGII